MSRLPIKLNTKVFEYNDQLFVFDCNNFNVFMINRLFSQIIRLAENHTEEEIFDQLSKLCTKDVVQAELDNLLNALAEGAISSGEDNVSEETDIFSKQENLAELTIIDLENTDLLKHLNQTDSYIYLWLKESELELEANLQLIKETVGQRSGRYRLNIVPEDNQIVDLYRKVRVKGLTNFDLRAEQNLAIREKAWSSDELAQLRAELFATMAADENPDLAIIQDILRILSFQQGQSCCQEGCWGRWLCGPVFGAKEASPLCSLYQTYFEMGILHFFYYLNQNPDQLQAILTRDLCGRFTAHEKGILSGDYFWQNNIRQDNYQTLQQFRQQPTRSFITYKHFSDDLR